MQNEEKKSYYIAILALSGIILHLILRFTFADANWPLLVVLAIGGGILVYDLFRKLLSFDFGSDLLAGVSIVTSVFLEEYLAGSLVVLMLSGGQALEAYAIHTASRVLEALAKRAPTTAHRKKGEIIEEVPIQEVAIGDQLVVFPHEICPVDGTVVEGNGTMDESFLTGEPFMIDKAPGSGVLSGSINQDDSITIQATKLAIDSRYAKIMKVMEESEQKRPHIRRIADQLGAWYTPLALMIACMAWIFSGESIRFLAVVVIATPCPLLIAIPVAIIGSISLCASRGILIKNPAVLEQMDQCQTIIFDKTGTLTYGRPTLTEQTALSSLNPKEVLTLAASLERYSKHPLAGAIVKEASLENLPLLKAEEVSEVKGEGTKGVIKGKKVWITSRKSVKISLPEGEGLECIIFVDNVPACLYRFRDAPRSDSTSFIGHLAERHGFKKTMIVSGDRKSEVQYLADFLGIKEVYAEMSPEQKVEIVTKETAKAKTIYLGDGINDAPALVVATCGIAFGQSSEITTEAADAVIMDNSLERMDEFLHISKRMRKIALQSALGGMGLSIVGMIIAALGYIPPVAGAIAQEVIDVLVILNALRTIWRPKVLTDMQGYVGHLQ